MSDIQKFAAREFARRNDRIKTPFGDAVITDIAYGFTTDAATDEPTGPVDDMIRVRLGDEETGYRYTYIYQSDIERNYTAENSILRA